VLLARAYNKFCTVLGYRHVSRDSQRNRPPRPPRLPFGRHHFRSVSPPIFTKSSRRAAVSRCT